MLTDQTAVVTGGSSGIGRAIAIEFADHGADVVVADVNRNPRDGGESTDELLTERGATSEFVRTDVSDPDSVAALFDVVAEELDGITSLVNCAGVYAQGETASDLSLEAWERALRVNLTGTFLCCKYAIPALLESDDGSIINISSLAGITGTRKAPEYGASKAGVANLTQSIAVDFAGDGLRANSIHPGLTDSPMISDVDDEKLPSVVEQTPMGRMAQPAEIARPAVYLASEYASYVTGHHHVVDGGVMARHY